MALLAYLKGVVATGVALALALVLYGWVRRLLDVVVPDGARP